MGVIYRDLINELFQDDLDNKLHPTKVTVRTGNDEYHTNECIIEKDYDGGLKIESHAIDVNKKESWGNRPRELDVKIFMEEEFDDDRILTITFHKGEVHVKWESIPKTIEKKCAMLNEGYMSRNLERDVHDHIGFLPLE